MLPSEPWLDILPFAVERLAGTAGFKISRPGATPSVEYIVPPTTESVKAVIPAPVLFNPTSPDIVPVPVIAVWAMIEKVDATPNPGSVAENVTVVQVIPSRSTRLNITVETLLNFFIIVF